MAATWLDQSPSARSSPALALASAPQLSCPGPDLRESRTVIRLPSASAVAVASAAHCASPGSPVGLEEALAEALAEAPALADARAELRAPPDTRTPANGLCLRFMDTSPSLLTLPVSMIAPARVSAGVSRNDAAESPAAINIPTANAFRTSATDMLPAVI